MFYCISLFFGFLSLEIIPFQDPELILIHFWNNDYVIFYNINLA